MTNDGQQLATGNEVQPSTPASAGNDQPSSETVNISKADWDRVQQTIKRLDDDTRSNKDRAVKKTNERLDKFEEYIPVLERVTNLMSEGISRDQALGIVKAEARQAENDETLSELRQLLKNGTLPTASSSGNGAVSGGKVAEVAKEFGLDENSAEIVNIYRQYGDSEAAEKAVLRLAASRAKENQPSASASTSIQGQPLRNENLMEQYERDAKGVRGNALIELKMEYRKKGLDIS